jgi:hypothetical protein
MWKNLHFKFRLEKQVFSCEYTFYKNKVDILIIYKHADNCYYIAVYTTAFPVKL